MTLTATAKVVSAQQNGDPNQQRNEFTLTLTNVSPAPVTVDRLDFLQLPSGGWVASVTDLVTEGLESNSVPSHVFDANMQFAPNVPVSFTFQRNGATAVAYAAFRLFCKGEQASTTIAVLRQGYDAPPSLPSQPGPVFVGFWANPMEIVDVWRNGNPVRWVTVGGMLFNGTGLPLHVKSVAIEVALDATLRTPSVPPQFLGKDGKTVAADPQGWYLLTEAVSPFCWGFDLSDCPSVFKHAELTVTVFYRRGHSDLSASGKVPLARIDAVPFLFPLRGRWVSGNGPDHETLDAHAWPGERFCLDLGKTVDKVTHKAPSGDPKSEDYYCYGQTVYAAAAGTVVAAEDQWDENVWDHDAAKFVAPAGPLANPGTNFIILKHANGFSGYYHLRKGMNDVKATDHVDAGQAIAQVGNSGNASEPHLHFGFVALDATGRPSFPPAAFSYLVDASDGPSDGTPVPVATGNGPYLSLPPKPLKTVSGKKPPL